jgi:hypothetical protein
MWEIQQAADAIATQEAKEPGLQPGSFQNGGGKNLLKPSRI